MCSAIGDGGVLLMGNKGVLLLETEGGLLMGNKGILLLEVEQFTRDRHSVWNKSAAVQ